MLFSINTDLAIRILIYLGVQPTNRFVALTELAAALNHKHRSLRLIVPQLIHCGLLESGRGCTGGVRLARSAASIRILEIVQLGEQKMDSKFAAKDRNKDRNPDPGCIVSSNTPSLEAMYDNVQAVISSMFSDLTIKEFCTPGVRSAVTTFSARWGERKPADSQVI
jgi:Rrf2 family protein